MSLRRSTRLFIAGCAFATVLIASPAHACSCATGDLRDTFEGADAAIVGEFLASRPGEPPSGSSTDDTIYTFRVIEGYKATFDETIDVHSALDGASCGLEVSTGNDYGLFLYRNKQGEWNSSLCSQVTPEEMREAASPLPEPDGSPPMRFLVGGSFSDQRVMALDGEGRTLAYGPGANEVLHISVCPEAEKMVEVVTRWPKANKVAVRDLSNMEVEESFKIPMRPRRDNVFGAHCADKDATKIFVMVTNYREPKASSQILRFDAGTPSVVHEGSAVGVLFVGEEAYLNEGRRGRHITRVTLDTGASRGIAWLSDGSYGVALSPDGDELATVVRGPYSMREYTAELVLIDLATKGHPSTSTFVSKNPDSFWEVLWVDSETIGLFGPNGRGGARIYDRSLDEIDRFRWSVRNNIAVDGEVWGAAWGLLQRAGDDGPIDVRELPSPVIYELVAVP